MPFVQVLGEKIYYVQQGERGLPVVFIHGAAGSHLIWGSQVHALQPIARAVAVDLPGHGKSTPTGRRSVEEYRDVILGVLDALGFDRAILVGHSMGGAIAQSFALAYPNRLAGIGLVGTGARLRVLPQILEGVIAPDQFVKTAEFVTDNSYAPDPDPIMRQRAVEQFLACDPQVTHGDFSACNSFDIISRVSEIRAPAIIICGREDRMTPVKYSEFLASKLGARLVLIDGAGHSVMIEKPDEVNQALVDFVGQLPQ